MGKGEEPKVEDGWLTAARNDRKDNEALGGKGRNAP